jgi:hypothetical protein
VIGAHDDYNTASEYSLLLQEEGGRQRRSLTHLVKSRKSRNQRLLFDVQRTNDLGRIRIGGLAGGGVFLGLYQSEDGEYDKVLNVLVL